MARGFAADGRGVDLTCSTSSCGNKEGHSPFFPKQRTIRGCAAIPRWFTTERKIMSSTAVKISGVGNEIAGKTKQAAGKAMGDSKLRVEGAAQEAKGDALGRFRGDLGA
jgi:uncharacterized protein YjbJ (UPF0337 family)